MGFMGIAKPRTGHQTQCMFGKVVQNFKVANMIFPAYWENDSKSPYVEDQFKISEVLIFEGYIKENIPALYTGKKYSRVT